MVFKCVVVCVVGRHLIALATAHLAEAGAEVVKEEHVGAAERAVADVLAIVARLRALHAVAAACPDTIAGLVGVLSF
jgi:hypothetical protein